MNYINPRIVVENHSKGFGIPKWHAAIMCFHSIEKTNFIVRSLDAKPIGYRLFSKCDENMVFEAVINNKKIGILGWCTGGGPMVASLIEELSVTGVKYVIGIGAAASIVNTVKRNEIIVPIKLLVNDGVSKVYSKAKYIKMQQRTRSIIRRVMLEEKIDYREVKGATIEALYRQNERILQPWRKKGIQVVNWELTPFFCTSKACGINCMWIGHISDVECNNIWENWYTNRKNIFEKVVKISKLLIYEVLERYEDES